MHLASVALLQRAAHNESHRGVGAIRVIGPRCAASDTVLLWRKAVAPIVEQIAVLLAGNALPTSLTQEKRSASRHKNNGTANRNDKNRSRLRVPVSAVGNRAERAAVFCSDACRIAFQAHSLTGTIDALNDVQAAPYVASEVPPIDAPLPNDYTLEQYRQEIAPVLARVPVALIRRATGLSYAYCKRIRRVTLYRTSRIGRH